MTEERRHVYLFSALGGIEKYTPIYNDVSSIPSGNYYDVIDYGRGKLTNTKGMELVFDCEKVKTDADEKKLRSYDLLLAGPGMFIFVSDFILNCLRHLIGKDIQLIPAKIYTNNGVVEGYSLIDIINVVHGVDVDKSTFWQSSSGTRYLEKLVPKSEDFMGGHELAREDEQNGNIYITPTLREKILKAKNGKKLRGLELITAKEDWEAGRNIEKCPY